MGAHQGRDQRKYKEEPTVQTQQRAPRNLLGRLRIKSTSPSVARSSHHFNIALNVPTLRNKDAPDRTRRGSLTITLLLLLLHEKVAPLAPVFPGRWVGGEGQLSVACAPIIRAIEMTMS